MSSTTDNTSNSPYYVDSRTTNLPLPKLINYIDHFPSTIPDLEKKLSVQTYIPSGSTSYDVNDANQCYVQQGSGPSINMTTDNKLYSPQACIRNAADLQMSFNTDFQNNFTSDQIGLMYTLYSTYINNNTTFFQTATTTPNASGLAKSLANINAATNNITLPDKVSIEWNGYFVPDQTGVWYFHTTSSGNRSMYLWIGDIAINDYTVDNASIYSSNTTTEPTYTFQQQFTAGVPYKIRIQFFAFNTPYSFDLSIRDPANNVTRGEKHLSNSLNDKDVAYFALVENSPENTSKGLFNCYLTDTKKTGVTEQLNAKNSQFLLDTVWQSFDVNLSHEKISVENYLYNDGTTLGIYKNGLLIQSLGTIGSGEVVGFGGQYGDLFIGSRNLTNNLLNNPGLTPVSNPLFVNAYEYFLKNNNNDLSIIHSGDVIKCLPENVNLNMHLLRYTNLNEYVRLTNEGNFIMFFTDGNLCISTNNSPCIKPVSTSNGLQYTMPSSNSFYPYSVNLENMNTSSKTSYLVFDDPDTNTRLKNDITLAVKDSPLKIKTKWTSYDNYVPSSEAESIIDDPTKETCQKRCDNNPQCNYYYQYKTNQGKTYCNYDTKYSTPKYASIQPGSSITSSKLNVKNFSYTVDETKVRDEMESTFLHNIPKNIITDTSILDTYTMDPTMTFESVYDQLTHDYYQAINLVNSMLKGDPDYQKSQADLTALLGRINTSESFISEIKEGYTNKREGFNSHGYVSGDFSQSFSGDFPGITPRNQASDPNYNNNVMAEYSEVTSTGLIKNLIEQKLQPLEQTANDYSNTLSDINTNYNSITNQVKDIRSIRNFLNEKPIYDFSGNILMGDHYDNDGNLVKFSDINPSIEDAIVDDTSNLMYRENTMYILGSITAAALIISAISIAR